jgi:hypothetical protein
MEAVGLIGTLKTKPDAELVTAHSDANHNQTAPQSTLRFTKPISNTKSNDTKLSKSTLEFAEIARNVEQN